LAAYVEELKKKKKGVIYHGETFFFGIIGEENALSKEQVQELSVLLGLNSNMNRKIMLTNRVVFKKSKKKKITTK